MSLLLKPTHRHRAVIAEVAPKQLSNAKPGPWRICSQSYNLTPTRFVSSHFTLLLIPKVSLGGAYPPRGRKFQAQSPVLLSTFYNNVAPVHPSLNSILSFHDPVCSLAHSSHTITAWSHRAVGEILSSDLYFAFTSVLVCLLWPCVPADCGVCVFDWTLHSTSVTSTTHHSFNSTLFTPHFLSLSSSP